MNLGRDVRHGARIGRAEFRRSVRQIRGDNRRLLGVGFAVLIFGMQIAFSLPVAYFAGRTARSVAAVPFLAPGAVILPAGLLLFAAFTTLERIGGVEAEDLLLTAVHPRAVVVGLIGAEIGRLAVWLGIPIAALAVAFAAGLGSPSLVVTAVLVLLPLLCCAAVWGYALGIAVLRVLRRLPGIRRVLKAVGILVFVVFVVGSQFAGQYIAERPVSVEGLLSAVTFEPLTDYVALAFLGTPLSRPMSPEAVAVLAALVALTPVGLAVASRQASELWLSDAPRRERSRRTSSSAGGFAPPRPFARTKSARIAWGTLVRAARNPQELNHLLMAIFFVGPFGGVFVQSGSLGPLAAGVGVGLGTYLAGATFGLNPLGDDRPQLPLLLLTETPTRTLVRGRMLAGLAVGLPVAVLVPLASVAVGVSPSFAVAFAAAGVGLCVAAAAFAVGVGAAYPIYEEREVWGTETVVPSTLVMVTYMFVVGGGTAVGVVLLWFTLAGHLGVTPAFVGGAGAYLLLACGVPLLSYRYAIRRYRDYTFD
ncbi:hypothetical protein [Halopelagius longus]|uniref:ABC-2 type transport system permease protein n=1 Tax=Halopelagius longus TaxID=1236180 RepID=A0A1H1G7G6_9EURY|nr:hypothetical protein [Halopelagius longus]RDI69811.1 hypothetical protein DWB78_16810 [Halopelagius longus]SDR08848.1 hypothetical protein SAMN05216278_3555 [Halopelagius longus]